MLRAIFFYVEEIIDEFASEYDIRRCDVQQRRELEEEPVGTANCNPTTVVIWAKI